MGVTLREQANGTVRVSLRTLQPLNASKICAKFGGGGHPGAAGCSLTGGLEQAKLQILRGIEEELEGA